MSYNYYKEFVWKIIADNECQFMRMSDKRVIGLNFLTRKLSPQHDIAIVKRSHLCTDLNKSHKLSGQQ
jgi:hypothetical protein